MLSKRWIINGAVVVLIAALLAIGFGFDDKSGNEDRAEISELRPTDISRVEISSADSLLRLQRDGDSWNIESPIEWPADGANVRRLLSIVDLDASALAQAADADLAVLGLDPPVASIAFNDTRLLFGATNNIGGRRYVMIGSTLYLLPDVHLAFATQGVTGIADRRLLPERFVIEALRLPDFEINRDGDGGWRSTRVAEIPQAQLQRLVTNWQTLPASRVKRFDISASAPSEHIEIRLHDGRVIDFLLLATDPEIVIANPQIDLQYHFRSDYRDQLISIGSVDDAG